VAPRGPGSARAREKDRGEHDPQHPSPIGIGPSSRGFGPSWSEFLRARPAASSPAHRGLGLATPEDQKREVSAGSYDEVSRRDLFGGFIHEYRAVAA
jgi:hypothetical protein